MRLLEVATDSLQILATKRFVRDLAFYLRGYPQLKKIFQEFCADKVFGRQFGKKDVPYTGSKLAGYWHAHLVHGKVIVVYRLQHNVLSLFHLGEHDDAEGSGIISLANYIESLSNNDFMPLSVFPEEPKLTNDQKKLLNELFFEMAASDPDIIRAAIDGDITDLMYFAAETVQESKDTILDGFGGEERLVQIVARILKQVGG